MADYYTIPDLAARWKCHEHLIYKYLRNGKLTGFKLGNEWRITDEARAECEARLTRESAPKRASYTSIN